MACSWNVKRCPYSLLIARKTTFAASIISLPIPSPGNKTICLLILFPPMKIMLLLSVVNGKEKSFFTIHRQSRSIFDELFLLNRSEERRVGKECRDRRRRDG